jgi:hypothetical protein
MKQIERGGKTCNALFVSPQFNGETFWAYKESCRLVGARYPAPSLGLLTVAAMLPETWDVRLIDRNVSEDEATFEALLDWADVVMTGGMLTQQRDLAYLFRDLATLRTTVPLFDTVDALEWKGPRPGFAALAERFEAAAKASPSATKPGAGRRARADSSA